MALASMLSMLSEGMGRAGAIAALHALAFRGAVVVARLLSADRPDRAMATVAVGEMAVMLERAFIHATMPRPSFVLVLHRLG
ncbi:MAG: hypothetical protein QME74_09010 [Candidatus Edwardsbacteria bacterium]|nr:hypothetical protein [Candidatus Edwardsbacteria bacterium]